jgi:hypothetical protein
MDLPTPTGPRKMKAATTATVDSPISCARRRHQAGVRMKKATFRRVVVVVGLLAPLQANMGGHERALVIDLDGAGPLLGVERGADEPPGNRVEGLSHLDVDVRRDLARHPPAQLEGGTWKAARPVLGFLGAPNLGKVGDMGDPQSF